MCCAAGFVEINILNRGCKAGHLSSGRPGAARRRSRSRQCAERNTSSRMMLRGQVRYDLRLRQHDPLSDAPRTGVRGRWCTRDAGGPCAVRPVPSIPALSKCDTGYDNTGRRNTTPFPRSHGRESGESSGFVETYIATRLTSSSHSSTERDTRLSAATQEGTSSSRTSQRRSTVQRRGCVRKSATRFRSCHRRQNSNLCAG